MHLKYRPDIDGLRALAVLPVVAFHLGLPGFSGGFVGVDVFFVISGYLIGAIIHRELRAGTFSLSTFYMRRFRRILPALFFLLAATWVFAAVLLLPADTENFGRSMLAATFSVSNILFWRTINYFITGESEILLHTWSLGVEEQFYLVFPLALMAVFALQKRWKKEIVLPMVVAAILVSFLICYILTPHHDTLTFYNLPTRGWELLLGFLASLVEPRLLKQPIAREIAGFIGIMLIVSSIILVGPRTLFPAPGALPACLGAALVILAGHSGATRVGAVLSLKPVVFVGLISYSLYLWHWPLIVLPRETLDIALDTGGEKALVLAASLAMAVFSWRFIERPFRSSRWTRRAVFTASAAGAAVLGAAALALILTGGFPQRYSARAVRLAAFSPEAPSYTNREGTCFLTTGMPFETYRPDLCLPKSGDPPAMILIGDSHAAHLWWGLRAVADKEVAQANAIGCIPWLPEGAFSVSPACSRMRSWLRETLPRRPGDTLILAGQYDLEMIDEIGESLDWAATHKLKVVLFGPVPQYRFLLSRLAARGAERGDPLYPARFIRAQEKEIDERLRHLAEEKGATYVSPFRTMCPDGKVCVTLIDDDIPIQRDHAHLSPEGSIWVMRRVWPLVCEAAGQCAEDRSGEPVGQASPAAR